MSEPIVFISHLRIKEGQADDYLRFSREMIASLDEEKPRTSVFLPYLNEDRSVMTVIHVFADADAMDAHFEGADERSARAYEFVEPQRWEIYGRPSQAALGTMEKAAAASGAELVVHPESVGGFLRTNDG